VETAAHDDGKTTALIADDDPDVRESTRCVLRTISLDPRAFVSPPKFINSDLPSRPTCLVLHVRPPGRSGLDFYGEQTAANVTSQSHSSQDTLTSRGASPML
jgi:FixJ family two-component response regulator